MLEPPPPDDAQPSGPEVVPEEHDLEVGIADFLPEGVALGDPAAAGDDGDDVDDEEPSPEADDAAPADEGARGEVVRDPGPDLTALEQIEADLAGVDAALAALDAGTYGRCRLCDAPIADDLLAADPTRTVCAAHAGLDSVGTPPAS